MPYYRNEKRIIIIIYQRTTNVNTWATDVQNVRTLSEMSLDVLYSPDFVKKLAGKNSILVQVTKIMKCSVADADCQYAAGRAGTCMYVLPCHAKFPSER